MCYLILPFGLYGLLYGAKFFGVLREARLRERRSLSRLITLLTLPYMLVCWTFLLLRRGVTREAAFDEIIPRIYLGALPFAWHRGRYQAAEVQSVVNCCFEFPRPLGYPNGANVHYMPTLDSTPPDLQLFRQAVDWAEQQASLGRGLLVHCAAGHGRSATLMIALLIRLGRFENLEDARSHVRHSRRGIYITRAQWRLLQAWIECAHANQNPANI